MAFTSAGGATTLYRCPTSVPLRIFLRWPVAFWMMTGAVFRPPSSLRVVIPGMACSFLRSTTWSSRGMKMASPTSASRSSVAASVR